MVPLAEHVRILGTIVNLILGIAFALIVYFRSHKLPFLYSKNILYYIVLFNLCIVILLISKYVELNLLNRLSYTQLQGIIRIMIICIILLLYKLEYQLLHIGLGILKFKYSKKYQNWTTVGVVIIIVALLFEFVYLQNFEPLELIGLIFICFATIDSVLLFGILIIGKNINDRAQKQLSISFSMVFLSRYVVLLFTYFLLRMLPYTDIQDISGAIGAFIIITYFNMTPLLWFYFFFLKYANNLSILIDRNIDLARFYIKYHITKREQDIIQLILEGKSNTDIKSILYISLHTVKNHIYNIYKKLNLNTRYELIHTITNLKNSDILVDQK